MRRRALLASQSAARAETGEGDVPGTAHLCSEGQGFGEDNRPSEGDLPGDVGMTGADQELGRMDIEDAPLAMHQLGRGDSDPCSGHDIAEPVLLIIETGPT